MEHVQNHSYTPIDLYTMRYFGNTTTNKLRGLRELYRPSDRRMSAKLVPTFADTP
jgi:hypothetical protein